MNPKTVAERVREHRQRKKDGANICKLAITPEQLEKARAITGSGPELAAEEVLTVLLDGMLARFDAVGYELAKLKELGATQAMADRYIQLEIERLKPLGAEEFMRLVAEGLSA